MSTPTATAAPVRSWFGGPLAGAVAVGSSFVLVHLVDPHQGHYPVCPTYALFGVYCPLCGGLRAANDLTRGDLPAALGSNLLVVLLVPVVLALWVRWTWARAHGSDRPFVDLGPRTLAVLGILALVFTVVRNLPIGAALAP